MFKHSDHIERQFRKSVLAALLNIHSDLDTLLNILRSYPGPSPGPTSQDSAEGPQSSSPSGIVVKTIAELGDDRKAQHRIDQEGQRLFERRYITVQWFLFAATLAAFLAAAYYGYVAKRQVVLMQDEAKRAHRPWVGVIGGVEIVSPLTVRREGNAEGSLRIRFRLKNTGTSPAINVQDILALTVNPQRAAYEALLKTTCKANANDSGAFILPGDDYETEMSLQFFSRIPPADATQIVPSAWLSMCITYSDEFGEDHDTGFLWQLRANDPTEFVNAQPGQLIHGTLLRMATEGRAH